uniref:Uncharacterized protein n=1 Tax=Anguilla anguilla TaxID=7936 RepID=A0A0E9UDA6_ANGAN
MLGAMNFSWFYFRRLIPVALAHNHVYCVTGYPSSILLDLGYSCANQR